jgi:hypothetical protein
MKRLLIYTALVVLSVTSVHAETRNRIYQWNNTYNIDEDPLDPNPTYLSIDQFTQEVTIVLGITDETFVFEARTQELQGQEWVDIGPGDIDLIQANVDAGDVTITILPTGVHTWGAQHVKEINLDATGVTGVIAGINISGNIATTGDAVCQNITGAINIGGNLGVAGILHTKLSATTASGPITINGTIVLYDRLEAGTLGDVTIYGSGTTPVQGDIRITNSYSGTLFIDHRFDGDLTIGDPNDPNDPNDPYVVSDLTGEVNIAGIRMGKTLVTGDVASGALIAVRSGGTEMGDALYNAIEIQGSLAGRVDVNGHLYGAGRITIGEGASQTDPNTPAIHIHGSLRHEGTIQVPRIAIGDELAGVIAIDGGLENVTTNGPEIQVGSLDPNDPNSLGAIAIDYDGYQAAHEWDPNAVIKVGTTEYTENNPEARVYEITECRGDMNNDEYVRSDDVTAFDLSAPDYATQFPGLLGSRDHHANVDCEGDIGDAVDRDWLQHFATPQGECCFSDCDYGACLPDTDTDGDVDLGDLATLLSNYGAMSGMLVADGDFDGDGDVDLTDLGRLLTSYGGECDCFPGGGGGGGGGGRSTITVRVDAYDTGGYTGAGFNGEVDHFVFDLKIQLSDPYDDWVATGAELDAYNDARFRLSTTPTTPDQYATFVAAPWTSVPESATANLAGAYDPPDPDPEFTTTGINLAWYDTVESNDGPATIMRIVIDVSEVEGADVSEGFGSVYFSTAGPAEKEDILVADIASETGTANSVPGLKWLSGEFYVKGKE